MTAPSDSAFAELACASDFSFLRGASHPQDLVLAALLLGHEGLGLADRNTVAGVVRAHAALRDLREAGAPPPDRVREGSGPGEYLLVERDHGDLAITADDLRRRAAAFRFAPGARLVFADGTPDVVAYPSDRAAWGRLCRLLTTGNLRGRKGDCILRLDDLAAWAEGLLLIVMPPRRTESLAPLLTRIAAMAPGAVWLGAAMHRRGDDRRRLARLTALADGAGMPLLATNDVLYAHPGERDLQDVMTCIREHVSVDRAGRLLEANAERHLKPPAEMARLFGDAPQALEETVRLLDRVDFSLSDLRYDYPEEPVPPGWTASDWLAHVTWRAAGMRYPQGIPDRVRDQITRELALIGRLGYEPYFLTILDIVRVANDRGILAQGRGSAANSAVCYVLGITCVDPAENDLLFARFISEERREPPDIDIDFEHERREEIIQHIYARYGRHRAGIAATVIRYRPRSAMREVGRALGLSEDVTARLASSQWGSWGREIRDRHIAETGLDPANPLIRRALDLARRLMGHPRHLSQHVGGFILTRGRLDELVPVGPAAMADRTFIEWDKDDIDELGLLKVDVLALGMLTAIRKSFDLMREHGLGDMALHDVPRDDPAVYAMLQKGDSIGVFQVESRAQMNMLPRLKPANLYDLVIQVAIVRPGPIQGDMVHPYLRRRQGLEKVEYPSPSPEHGPADELWHVLNKTKGVPLFQEQAMRLAMVAARFTDAEANGLRKAMATFRNVGTIGHFEQIMVGRMVARGYDPAFAARCFEQIKGFGSYGFPESHAASFAKLVYGSSWIKCHHPGVFACALLNSQPMGFYAPAQIVRDAAEHGVEVRGVDVNHSHWDSTLETRADGGLALRLGMRQIDGMPRAAALALVAARKSGFVRIEEVAARSGLPVGALHRLADADAFRSLGLDRRGASWALRRLPDAAPLPLFAAADARELAPEADAGLPAMRLGEHVAADYQTVRLSLKAHPMQILRPVFARERVVTCRDAADHFPDGRWVAVAGIVLVRQRPGNGNAIFVTIEDETGIANVILWARVFEMFRRPVLAARLMLVEGRVQRSPEGVAHLLAVRVHDRSAELERLADGLVQVPMAHADEFRHPQTPRGTAGHPRDARLLPKSRDFH